MHLFAFERVRYRSIGCVCARLTHDNPRIRPHETPDNQQLRGMEIALRARLNRTVTIARIALAHSSLAILSKFSIERISSKRNGQEEGENDVVEWPFLSATGVPFFSIPDWVAHFWLRVQYRDVVFRYHCVVRKAERFVWEIYLFFFFMLSSIYPFDD